MDSEPKNCEKTNSEKIQVEPESSQEVKRNVSITEPEKMIVDNPPLSTCLLDSDVDLMTLCTSKFKLDSTYKFDSSLEVIGLFNGIIFGPAFPGDSSVKLFKFLLTNGLCEMEILTWGDKNIARIMEHTQHGNIIHLNPVLAQPRDYVKQNELPQFYVIRDNTRIFSKTLQNPDENVDGKVEEVCFEEALEKISAIFIKGFLMYNFEESVSSDGTSCAIGVVTDEKLQFKLQVKIARFTSCSIEEGAYICMKGRMNQDNATPIFIVNCTEDVQVLKNDRKVTFEDFMNVTKSLRKRLNKEPGKTNSKVFKI